MNKPPMIIKKCEYCNNQSTHVALSESDFDWAKTYTAWICSEHVDKIKKIAHEIWTVE